MILNSIHYNSHYNDNFVKISDVDVEKIFYIAAILRGYNYQVTIIDGWLAGMSVNQVADSILECKDILAIGFSCYMSNIRNTMEVVRQIKSFSIHVPIFCGGFGPTFHPVEFLDEGFDFVVRGEGEQTVIELCRYFESGIPKIGEILGISYKENQEILHNKSRPLLADLNCLPFPERDTLPLAMKRRSTINILSSRGCNGNCIFCSIVSFMKLSDGKQWRERTINNFVNELDQLYIRGVRHFKVIGIYKSQSAG